MSPRTLQKLTNLVTLIASQKTLTFHRYRSHNSLSDFVFHFLLKDCCCCYSLNKGDRRTIPNNVLPIATRKFFMEHSHCQYDHIGHFLKGLGDKFSFKSSQNIWWRFGLFWEMSFFKKKLLWQHFGQLGLLFILASGHPDHCFYLVPTYTGVLWSVYGKCHKWFCWKLWFKNIPKLTSFMHDRLQLLF